MVFPWGFCKCHVELFLFEEKEGEKKISSVTSPRKDTVPLIQHEQRMKKKRVSPLLRRKLLFLFSRHSDGWQVSSDTIGRSRQHEITPSFNIYTRQRPGRDGVTEKELSNSCALNCSSTLSQMACKIETKTNNNNNNKENGIFFSQLGRVEGLIPKVELLSFLQVGFTS